MTAHDPLSDTPLPPVHLPARPRDDADGPGTAQVPVSPAPAAGEAVLDEPAWSSLTGAHRHLAIGNEHVLRYPSDVSPFVGVRDW